MPHREKIKGTKASKNYTLLASFWKRDFRLAAVLAIHIFL